ncbi:hypothetical protein B0H17DRAFT_1129992 [Mycena rosella]|uniref:Uncharacterized protein n=1 Tax=Mycena rosella TaxID=1033263 RepID=A0AAD7DTN2_MYCRO|nr:hypothetical protein B0H17DRAFT_1129992 [Mycena rosella]
MYFLCPQIFSEFMDLSCGKYEPSDDGSRSGIGFGGRFGVWEKHIKTFLFFSFHVHTSLNFIGGPEFEMRSGSTIIPHQGQKPTREAQYNLAEVELGFSRA